MLQGIAAIMASRKFANGYYRALTLDQPGSDLTDFPLTFTGTYSYLKTIANGGKVNNANGYDITFYSDSSLTTLLSFERVYWDGATGDVEFHIKIPTLTSASATVIYLSYGRPTITTDQQNASGTWNSNYKGVYHLPNGTSLTVNDSTGNGNNGTNTGVTATTGKIDGAGAFLDTATDILLPSGLTRLSSAFTVSAWINTNTVGATEGYITSDWSGTGRDYLIERNGSAINCFVGDGGSNQDAVLAGGALSTSTWYLLHLVVNGTSHKVYLNSTEIASQTGSFSGGTTSNDRRIGADATVAAGFGWAGSLDEIRYIGTNLSVDWINAEYSNQNDPANFYAIGAETPV